VLLVQLVPQVPQVLLAARRSTGGGAVLAVVLALQVLQALQVLLAARRNRAVVARAGGGAMQAAVALPVLQALQVVLAARRSRAVLAGAAVMRVLQVEELLVERMQRCRMPCGQSVM
jgi:hypothetical protein